MIGFIVPARNEEENIKEVINAIVSAGVRVDDIFVIDNNSSDNTARIAVSSGAKVFESKKRGYQATLNEGLKTLINFNYSKFCIIDGDNEIKSDSLKSALCASEDYNFIIGKRPYVKRFGEKIVNYLMSRRYGVDDLMCGLKLGDLKYYNPNNRLEYGIDLFDLNKIKEDKILNIDIGLNSRNDTRLGNVFKVNTLMLILLVRYFFSL